MATTYQPLVYKEQGGNTLVIQGKDGGVIKGQATAGATPAQHATIADVSVATIAWTTGDKAKVNTLIAALENIGVLATS